MAVVAEPDQGPVAADQIVEVVGRLGVRDDVEGAHRCASAFRRKQDQGRDTSRTGRALLLLALSCRGRSRAVSGGDNQHDQFDVTHGVNDAVITNTQP